jgi:hypothetical protein
MIINVNIPHAYWFFNMSNFGSSEVRTCIVHALQSFAGKALHFHVLTDFGANFSTVSLDSLYHKEPSGNQLPLDFLQLWDCFSNNASFITYNYLSECRVKVLFKDKSTMWGNYFGTVYWYDNGYTDEPTQFKEGHIILLDNGQIAVQPNNRLIFKDMSFTNKNFPDSKITPVTKRPSVESVSERWILSDDDFFYDIKQEEDGEDI